MLTLEERERIAYANGDVPLARLLAEALDHAADEYASGRADGYDEGYTTAELTVDQLERHFPL